MRTSPSASFIFCRHARARSYTELSASGNAFIYTLKVFGVSLNLFDSEEIHQAGGGTAEQRSIGSAEHIRGNNGC